MELPLWLTVYGDFLSLLGGIVLALEAINKEREYLRHKAVDAMITSPEGRLVIEIGAERLEGADAFAHLSNRRTAKHAIWGCALLVSGFLLLLSAHLLEALRHVHPPV
jgi:hypothetical protein